MARIGIAGFIHETNTFASSRANFTAFAEPDAWPGLLVGHEMLTETAGMNSAVSGFIDAMRVSGHTLVPLVWCAANPCGLVTRDAFEAIDWLLTRTLRDAVETGGPLDMIFLDLHGAMVCEHLDDGEGELLRRLRQRAGPSMPLVAALDFHANVSRAMVETSDLMLAYRTYPHVDMADTGRRAAALSGRLLRGERPARAWRTLPFLIPMPWQSTLTEPGASLMALAGSLEQSDQRVWSTSFTPGFPLADVPDSGPSVVVYADCDDGAANAADALYEAVLAAREQFGGQLLGSADAVARARMHAEPRPIILADTQDNPGGGGSGDTTDLLHELLRQGAQQVLAGVVCDAAFAAAAHAAGIGNRLSSALGGISGVGAPPLTAEFDVLALGDGNFTGTGPFYAGCRMALGPMARVRTGGVEIVVSSRKQQAADQAMFRHVGAEPAAYRVLVLKSSVHFRADFGALADEIVVVTAPGVNTADLHQLTYRHLRPGIQVCVEKEKGRGESNAISQAQVPTASQAV